MSSGPDVRQGEILGPSDQPKGGGFLSRRVRIALWIAAIEGLLIIVNVIDKWPAIIIAAAILVAYFLSYNRIKSKTGREIAWIVAASQALVILVPILFSFVKTIAYLIVIALAVVALLILFRRGSNHTAETPPKT
jgi:hypothetical protein